MFDEKEALKLLKEDRRKYIKRTIEFAQGFLDRNMDDAAETAIITAGQELSRLNGSIQYVERLAEFAEYSYPRFSALFDDV